MLRRALCIHWLTPSASFLTTRGWPTNATTSDVVMPTQSFSICARRTAGLNEHQRANRPNPASTPSSASITTSQNSLD